MKKRADIKAADRRWADAIKSTGVCAALARDIGPNYGTHLGCSVGPLDAAHIFSRTFPATRHDPANGLPLCRSMHVWFTSRPLAWERFCRSLIGDAEYERLSAKAHGLRK